MTSTKGAETTAKQTKTMTERRTGVINTLNILFEAEAKRQRNKKYRDNNEVESYELYGEVFKRIKKEEYSEQEKKLFNILKVEEQEELTAILIKSLYELYKRLETSALYGDDKELVKPIKHNEFINLFKDEVFDSLVYIMLKIKTQVVEDIETTKKQLAFEKAILAQQMLEEQQRQQLEEQFMSDSQM